MFNIGKTNPPIAIEIGEGYGTVVRVNNKRDNLELIDFHQVSMPPMGRPGESLMSDYTFDDRMLPAMEELLGWAGKIRRISLVLPDPVARSYFLEVENPSKSHKELRDILYYKIQRVAPVNVEGSALSFRRLRNLKDGGALYLALLASRSQMASYERYFNGKGIHLGRIETGFYPTTDLFRQQMIDQCSSGNFALVRVESGYFVVGLFQNQYMAVTRIKGVAMEENLPKRVLHELKTLDLFAQDRLGGKGISHTFVCGPGRMVPELEDLAESSGIPMTRLSLRDVMGAPGNLSGNRLTEGRVLAAAASAARR